jgi:Caspase domain
VRCARETKVAITTAVLSLLFASYATLTGQTNTGTSQSRRRTASSSNSSATSGDGQTGGQLSARGVQRKKYTPDQQASFEAEKRNAVLVAPNYRDSGLPSLRFTYNDAAELRSELERQGYTVHMVPSTEATADGIREALEKQKTYLDGSSQATLLFAFMGHGFQDTKGKNYLMTYGADMENMDKEALPVDEVEDLLNKTGARRKIIFIDACRSSVGTRDATKPRSMADFKAAEGMSIFLATKPGAYSYEDPELSHGLFTYYLLEGLRGKAAGADGFVSFQDLTKYVEKSVDDYAEKKDMAQKPVMSSQDLRGDFLMATAAPAKAGDIKPLAAASQISSDTPIMQALGTGQSFFVAAEPNSLTLIAASTGRPYAILREDPTQMKNADEVSKRSLHWFGGDAPDGKTIQMVAEMKGNDIAQIWGRIGKACPGDKPCTQTPYPLLPGEVRPSASLASKTAGKATKTMKDTFAAFGHRSSTVNGTAGASDAVSRNGLVTDDKEKFIWANFDLTSTLKAPQPTAQGNSRKP